MVNSNFHFKCLLAKNLSVERNIFVNLLIKLKGIFYFLKTFNNGELAAKWPFVFRFFSSLFNKCKLPFFDKIKKIMMIHFEKFFDNSSSFRDNYNKLLLLLKTTTQISRVYQYCPVTKLITLSRKIIESIILLKLYIF